MASDKASAGATALSSVSGTQTVPSNDGDEKLDASAKTMSASKRRPGRKSTPKSFNESLLDDDDLEHLRKPFTFGWKREVVYRNVPPGQSKTASMCDIYYFSPSGKKLRSMVEIAAYVASQKDSPVNLTHFTFKRMGIFSPPHEIIRTAGNKTGRKFSDNTVISNGAENVIKTEITNSERRNSKKVTAGVNLSTEPFHVTGSNKQLTPAPKDSQAVTKDTAEDVVNSSETLTNPNVQLTVTPVTFIRGRGRPKGSKDLSARLSTMDKLQKHMRVRRRSPDWSPDFVRSPKTPLKKRNVEVIKNSLETTHSSDDDDSDMQNILGTPSKLIASIVRPEPPKRYLEEVTDQTSKKMKTAHGFIAISSAPTLLDNSFQQSKVMVTNPHFLKLCTRYCPNMRGIEPTHKCMQCGLLYHKVCSLLESKSANKGLCGNCAKEKTGTTVRLMPLSSSQQFKPQQSLLRMVPPSMTTQGLGSLADPIVFSPYISSTSSQLSKPLMTSSSQLFPQLLSPVFLNSGQNATTIPPPPPLASCPRFDTPMTLLPVSFTSEVSPPRLQLYSIPQISQTPPLLLAGSIVPPCSQTSSFITQLPALQPSPPSLASQPPTFYPSLTTASKIMFVTRVMKTTTDIPMKNVSTSTYEVRTQDQLADATRQTSLMTVGSQTSSSTTDTIVLSDDEDTEASGTLTVPSAGSQISGGLLHTIKDLLKKRIRAASSASDDIDDYPPVTFDPAITENATRLHSESENGCAIQAPHSVNFNGEMDSELQNGIKLTPLVQSGEFVPSSSHVLIDILNRASINSIQTPESASLAASQGAASHIIKVNPDHLSSASNMVTGSNCYLQTLSYSVASRMDHSGALAMTSSSAEFSLPPPEKHHAVSTQILSETEPTEQTILTRKNFLKSFRILHTSFNIMMNIFGHLPLPDLLRASCVCKMWRQLGMQPCLWRTVHLEHVKVWNWEKAAWFFNKVCVKRLNLKCFDFQSNENITSASVWDNIKKNIPTLTHLEELFFDSVPASVLDIITEKMPHLVSIGAQTIIDSGGFTATPMIPLARTVERMSQAIEAVTYGRWTTTNAAKLFQVSEKDLIHLTQTTDKLTSDEEAAVLLCCLRMNSMGFCVQKDTVMSKCQEMISRRYSTDTSVPLSDSYCKDLYHRNVPLLMAEVEIKRSDTLRERFDVYYSALKRFYSSLWPKTILTADQVLAFDLRTFSLGKDQRSSAVSSVGVTVLSVMSGCTRLLPIMAVWPKLVPASHPDLFNVVSKRGMPTYLNIFQYFQKILHLVKVRPLVILCHGNASLLSEKLISTCLSDSVYLHCVPADIAKFVFPGFHGGLLHMLKAELSDCVLTGEDFATKLLNLLISKKKSIRRSSVLAFTATGAFPHNAKAPVQYQALDVNDLSKPICSRPNLSELPDQQCSQSSNESVELVSVTKPGNAQITSVAKKFVENDPGDVTEVMSKSQEMISSTDTPALLSDLYCTDLYHHNMPLSMSEVETKSSDTLRERFDAYYSALERFYNILCSKTTLTADQVLAFDLRTFGFNKNQRYSTVISAGVTILSVMSGCTRQLPVMAVWPKLIPAPHPDLINVMSKRGMPTDLHILEYFQKILHLVKLRPLVILCHGNASLLTEKLISSFLSDSVYLYSVPADIAKFVFPGFHGGLLHMLEAELIDYDLSMKLFANRLLNLLISEKKSISRSTMLAFTATGAFPHNAKAPVQYQALDVNDLSKPICSRPNLSELPDQQCSQSSSESIELVSVTKPGNDQITSVAKKFVENDPGDLTEMMSKSQEMISSTDTSVPLLDSDCRDLYHCNMPLSISEVEITRSDTLRERFDVYYSILKRFYDLCSKTTFSADQVLAFDLRTFDLGQNQRSSAAIPAGVTVLSFMSGCTRLLPVMAVWPKLVPASHPDLINVMSEHGMPTDLHILEYFQKILHLVKVRPLVILCHGNASLLSGKLISTCLSDSVYLHCVPMDIAKFVFPGFHGGLLHMLKAELSDCDLTGEDFATKLLNLLVSKKKSVSRSTMLAFTATGAFPHNAKAPVQYQALNVNDLSKPICSLPNLSELPDQQCSQSPNESIELVSVTKPGNDQIASVAKKFVENHPGDITDKNSQVQCAANKVAISDQILSTTQLTSKNSRKDKKRINYAQLCAKKVLKKAKSEQNSSNVMSSKANKKSVSSLSNADCNLNSVATGSDVIADQQQSTPVHQSSNFKSSNSHPHIETSIVRSEIPPVEMDQELVHHRPETERTQCDSSTSVMGLPGHRYAPAGVGHVSVADVNMSSSCVELAANTNLINKEQTFAVASSSGTHQALSKPIGSNTDGVKGGNNATDSKLLVSHKMNRNKAGAEVSSERNCNNDENDLENKMDNDTAIKCNVIDKSDRLDSLNVSSVSARKNDKKDANNRNVKVKSRASEDDNEEMDVSEDHEPSISNSPVTDSSQRKKKWKKHETRQKLLEPSCAGTSARTAGINIIDKRTTGSKINANRTAGSKINIHRTAGSKINTEKTDGSKINTDQTASTKINTDKTDSSKINTDKTNSSKINIDDIVELGTELETKKRNIHHFSLIDHDYIKFPGMIGTGNDKNGGDSPDSETMLDFQDSWEIPGDTLVEEIATEVKTLADCVLATDDVIHVGINEEVTETVCSQKYDSTLNCNRFSHVSSNTSGSSNDTAQEYDKNTSMVDNKTEGNSSSILISPQASDDDNEDSNSSDGDDSGNNSHTSDNDTTQELDKNTSMGENETEGISSEASDDDNEDSSSNDGDDSGDNSHTSDLEDAEEADEDDDSKCQMCMRTVPPHSKDKIINWVDCDGNCGRWFHVICVTRSQSKADAVHFVCPSCRCNR